jgi:hypothetical protein
VDPRAANTSQLHAKGESKCVCVCLLRRRKRERELHGSATIVKSANTRVEQVRATRCGGRVESLAAHQMHTMAALTPHLCAAAPEF